MRYYMNGKKIVLPSKRYQEGDEGLLYSWVDEEGNEKLIKILKGERRKNLRIPREQFYLYQTKLSTEKFYLPQELIYDAFGNFSGCLLDFFPNGGNLTYAQCSHIEPLIQELKAVEEELVYLTEKHIHLGDLKLEHILYDFDCVKLGIVDSGLYYYDEQTTLVENFHELNYSLIVGLLWMNVLGEKIEMKSVDFPEVYDVVEAGEQRLSSVLEEECEKYSASTIIDLKKSYQKQRMY